MTMYINIVLYNLTWAANKYIFPEYIVLLNIFQLLPVYYNKSSALLYNYTTIQLQLLCLVNIAVRLYLVAVDIGWQHNQAECYD